METVEFLRNVDLFQHLDEESLVHLAEQMKLVTIPGGIIIRYDDPVDGLYIVKSGTAGVSRSKDGGVPEAALSAPGKGAWFGEIGLLDGLPRTATVTAMGPTECYFLPREAFMTALEEHSKIARGMLPAVATMVRNADQWVANLLRI